MLQKLAARNRFGLRRAPGSVSWLPCLETRKGGVLVLEALTNCDGGGPLPSSVFNKYVELSECEWSVACSPGVSPSGQSDLQAGPLRPRAGERPPCHAPSAASPAHPGVPYGGGASRPTSGRPASGRGDAPRAGWGWNFQDWPMRSGLQDAGRVPLGAGLPPAGATATPTPRSRVP